MIECDHVNTLSQHGSMEHVKAFTVKLAKVAIPASVPCESVFLWRTICFCYIISVNEIGCYMHRVCFCHLLWEVYECEQRRECRGSECDITGVQLNEALCFRDNCCL